ncbi:mandelate racemase/muconate lactonizing enzyme family protein [Cupriavidus sp. 2TAF22]|uniref:mandelate racemase/muconate lactonizing enzyme family protein n=1 Tax=unclassified Cupriavidus TaxID=2640874 RepID=UPI003F9292B6
MNAIPGAPERTAQGLDDAPVSSATIDEVIVRHLEFPLKTPYRLSSGDLTLFDPIVIEIRDSEGRSGWGEALIIPGYTHESMEVAWQVASTLAERIVGLGFTSAAALSMAWLLPNPGVVSAILAALDMLGGEPMLRPAHDVTVPLLAPCQAHDAAQIREEVDSLVEQGFRTLKVKVGYAWQDDLDRLQIIQDAVGDRATLRLDANRGFSRAHGIAFAQRLHPGGIELLEQPCGAEDWDDNAAVAAVSTVPLMLDESIYGPEHIERAATIANVGFVKLKLKKVGSAGMLRDALNRIRELGMTPVMGDGVSIEIGCWMEACVAARTIDNAGEMNGFLKVRERLFANPLVFQHGAIRIPAGYWPEVDRHVLAVHTRDSKPFRAARRYR